eukprot:scaffold1690_cov59-Phaeocystis_antarctica.AAC.1
MSISLRPPGLPASAPLKSLGGELGGESYYFSAPRCRFAVALDLSIHHSPTKRWSRLRDGAPAPWQADKTKDGRFGYARGVFHEEATSAVTHLYIIVLLVKRSRKYTLRSHDYANTAELVFILVTIVY